MNFFGQNNVKQVQIMSLFCLVEMGMHAKHAIVEDALNPLVTQMQNKLVVDNESKKINIMVCVCVCVCVVHTHTVDCGHPGLC